MGVDVTKESREGEAGWGAEMHGVGCMESCVPDVSLCVCLVGSFFG